MSAVLPYVLPYLSAVVLWYLLYGPLSFDSPPFLVYLSPPAGQTWQWSSVTPASTPPATPPPSPPAPASWTRCSRPGAWPRGHSPCPATPCAASTCCASQEVGGSQRPRPCTFTSQARGTSTTEDEGALPLFLQLSPHPSIRSPQLSPYLPSVHPTIAPCIHPFIKSLHQFRSTMSKQKGEKRPPFSLFPPPICSTIHLKTYVHMPTSKCFPVGKSASNLEKWMMAMSTSQTPI